MDAKTTQIASELVALYNAAMGDENLDEMKRIIDAVATCPNRHLRSEVMRLLNL
jgi:ferredoxin